MTLASRSLPLAALLAAAGAGFGVSRWAPPQPPPDGASARLERLEGELRALRQGLEATSRPAPVLPARMDVTALREDLRRMLREELQSAEAQAPAQRVEERPAPAPSLSPRNLEAFSKANQLVVRSLASRQWGNQERGELVALRGQMTAEQFQELI